MQRAKDLGAVSSRVETSGPQKGMVVGVDKNGNALANVSAMNNNSALAQGLNALNGNKTGPSGSTGNGANGQAGGAGSLGALANALDQAQRNLSSAEGSTRGSALRNYKAAEAAYNKAVQQNEKDIAEVNNAFKGGGGNPSTGSTGSPTTGGTPNTGTTPADPNSGPTRTEGGFTQAELDAQANQASVQSQVDAYNARIGLGSAVSSATGTAVSAADQSRNRAAAQAAGGYDDSSAGAKIGNTLSSMSSGAALGPIGAAVGLGYGIYSNYFNGKNAGSRAQTGDAGSASNPGSSTTTGGETSIGGIAGGALGGALTGLGVAGPAGAIIGALGGAINAAGGFSAQNLSNLKGQSQLNQGKVAGSAVQSGVAPSGAPFQNVNNGGRDQTATGNGSGGTSGNGNTGGTGTNTGTGTGNGTGSGGQNAAGNSGFNQYLSDLRQRNLANLLYTGAGWSGTSGTSLLGRVGASQGAVGGNTGQVITKLGGGQSLIGGAWGW
jgi:hypothetical protein